MKISIKIIIMKMKMIKSINDSKVSNFKDEQHLISLKLIDKNDIKNNFSNYSIFLENKKKILNLYQYLFPFIIQKKKEIDFLIKYSDEIYKY